MRLTRLALAGALALAAPLRAEEPAPDAVALFRAWDVQPAWSRIEEVVAQKDGAGLPGLVRGALATPYWPLAWSVGEALAALGATKDTLPSDTRALLLEGRPEAAEAKRALVALLAAWGDPAVDAPLARWMGARSEVAEAAAYAVGGLPWTDAATWPECEAALRLALEDRRPAVRLAACLSAGRARRSALRDLLVRVATRDTARDVAFAALRALERLGAGADMDAFVKPLAAGLEGDARAVALRGVTTLAAPRDAERLITLLAHRREDVRVAAAGAVARWMAPARYGLPESDPPPGPVLERIARGLVGTMKAPLAWPTRMQAALALGRFGVRVPADAVAELVSWLDSKVEEEVTLALVALTPLRAPSAAERVWRLALDAESAAHRRMATRLLEALDAGAAAQRLLAALASQRQPGPRLRIVEALGSVRHETVVRSLVGQLASGRVAVALRGELEYSLERLTGHRFGANAAAWEAWLGSGSSLLRRPLPMVPGRDTRAAVRAQGSLAILPAAERVLQPALDWIVRAQRVDGRWDSREAGWGGEPEAVDAYTSACVVLLLGAGAEPGRGRHGEPLLRALEALAARQDHVGGFPDSHPDYNNTLLDEASDFLPSIGAYAFLAGRAAQVGAEWGVPAQRALDGLILWQMPGGGWGQQRGGFSNAWQTCLACGALAQALVLGLDVPAHGLDDAEAWLRFVTNSMEGESERPDDVNPAFDASIGRWQSVGAHAAQTGVLTERARQARTWDGRQSPAEMIGWTRVLLGWPRSHPYVVGAARLIETSLPAAFEISRQNPVECIHVRLWVATQHMYAMGGDWWRRWSESLLELVTRSQDRREGPEHGSFSSDTAHVDVGRLWATTMVALCLSAWYRTPWPLPR